MKLEVLASTMAPSSKVKEVVRSMNLSTDAIIINQCESIGYQKIASGSHSIRVFNFEERGLSVSRNEGLLRLDSDIAIFADDDEKFENDYATKIITAFKQHPEADLIVFNNKMIDKNRSYYQNKKWKRIRRYNCLRYGSPRIAFRVEKIRKNNIFMNILLGAGTEYLSGEDSVFLFDCIKKGLKIYASPKCISTINQANSIWFNGYTDEYYIKKGAVFACLYDRWLPLFAFLFAIKHAHEGNLTAIKKYRLIMHGVKKFKNRRPK